MTRGQKKTLQNIPPPFFFDIAKEIKFKRILDDDEKIFDKMGIKFKRGILNKKPKTKKSYTERFII